MSAGHGALALAPYGERGTASASAHHEGYLDEEHRDAASVLNLLYDVRRMIENLVEGEQNETYKRRKLAELAPNIQALREILGAIGGLHGESGIAGAGWAILSAPKRVWGNRI